MPRDLAKPRLTKARSRRDGVGVVVCAAGSVLTVSGEPRVELAMSLGCGLNADAQIIGFGYLFREVRQDGVDHRISGVGHLGLLRR